METENNQLTTRQNEVAQYSANIALYKAILLKLPTEWPEKLLQYRDTTERHKVASQIDNLDDVALLSKLWYADDCYKAIRSETVEKTKAEANLEALS